MIDYRPKKFIFNRSLFRQMAWQGPTLLARKYSYLFGLLGLIALSSSQPGLAAPEVAALNQRFAELAEAYYRDAARELKGTIFIKQDVKSLRKHLIKLVESQESDLANAVLLANFPLVLTDIDARTTPFFLQLLLAGDLWHSANRLAQQALNEGGTFTSSRIHYHLGEYFFDRGDLDQAFEHLTAIESSAALTPTQRDYATLMFGIALQKRRQHRQALTFYRRIAPDSFYYSYAQLNTAVANIRQGWWTDAQLAIESALAQELPAALREVGNRLLLVLAYSQLQNEFYRNARQTFRKVSLDSRYVNKALLGIGLCALNQQDHGGALNAFVRLQDSGSEELAALEAHLMAPYTYDQMGRLDEAATGYAEAIAFFDVKIRELEAERFGVDGGAEGLTQSHKAATIMAQKIRRLQAFDLARTKAATRQDIDRLKRAYREQIVAHQMAARQDKIAHLKSYLSQSQYGLAKLYDSQ